MRSLPARHALRTPDGETLALQDWSVESGAARAVVVVVHGLGEHAGRYAHVADRLNDWGFEVRAVDHYGHGASSGARGGLPTVDRLLDDLALVIDDTRQTHPALPLVLLGHSLGGLVAASFVARGVRPVDALVLSSPALDPGLSAFQKFLVATLSRIAPTLRVGNGLDLQYLSHDPAVAKAYRADSLCHDRIGARLARFLADEGASVQAAAARWAVPTLLIYAGDDRLVDPAGSRAFAQAAPPSMVSTTCYAGHYHEIFNEREADPVFERLRRWLDERFALP
ncbi:Lysophospholipase, alpha-beta hydrolase superfamily [Variovorax sp. HW608]|uniref:alpha/beta hydrolase n=1 Tax=Variovorax sp. HW608 TaxID=1034889 RepID=UPI00081FD89D|nr:alpha/beta hydrolase [Variovorax sp. HW608]SCK62260.1 Lysophospholipase, alpha-beta hydrolase superfamily [Variovorax sp. HW608]